MKVIHEDHLVSSILLDFTTQSMLDDTSVKSLYGKKNKAHRHNHLIYYAICWPKNETAKMEDNQPVVLVFILEVFIINSLIHMSCTSTVPVLYKY